MKCRVCGSDKLINVLDLGEQYLSEFRDDGKLPDHYPISMVMCKQCTLVQLKESTPPSALYTDNYGYYSGINNTIKADLEDVVTSLSKYVQLCEGDTVIDIGSNDATLLKLYPQELTRIGFDPVSKFKEFYTDGLHFINDYFNKEALLKEYKGIKPKVITSISCFYDLEDPNKFVEDVRQLLHRDGVFVIEQNYLATMLENIAYDNIVHEHIEYYTLKSLEYLLSMHLLKVVDVQINEINGGAFRVYVKHMSNVEKMREMERQMKLDNQFTYLLFKMKIKKVSEQVNQFVKKVTSEGKTVYTYGASTRGNSLLQVCGLDKTLIKAAVERNPVKFGKTFLGIPIISEEQMRKDKPDYLLVLPWFFIDEFKKREKEYLDNGGHLIVPLPKFEII